ncbi:DEAD/DEAH box helicase family protein [Bacillus velezensis]|uniref:DEAD/DEAH box helicase n=1 Tax=Bacillus subtilis group TaxID=653685 RepID=UPI0022E4CC23|nr:MULTISPECIES: DEAD/DEAH box helicase family protein [Bacillus subtilis group]MEC0384860.1 DEAD/DEAH box helicase family protein [Bacillus velezensis]MEC0388173.1 DEAD/DEAH box helicase family protein [Bacillus velezensis]MEC0436296.1 DEAD/DEAH box helicase family protein [Bacillus subtilis]
MIELKNFQQDVVDKLLAFIAPEYGINNLTIKAPTGAGKTIMLLSWIDEYIRSTGDNVAFVWFTPGAGELEEQSQDKANSFSSIKAQSVDDALLNGFDQGSATFINYERVVGKKSKAMLTDSERDNLVDKIEKAFQNDRHFIVIIDEAHRNDTNKAREIISRFKASKTVRVSATIDDPNTPDILEFYEVLEESVIASGLITKAVVVNEEIDTNLDGTDEFAILFDAAEKKRQQIVANYIENDITGINPLVLVQLPDESTPDLSLRIEKHLQETMDKTYEDGKLGIWLSEQKRNVIDVNKLDNKVEYLIIKQAIATGWDAPRAKILIKIRENMGEQFTVQTLGRIRRMPQPWIGHYNVDVLDNAYLYTFDTDFLNGVFAQGAAVAPTPLLNLKDKGKNLKLISERVINYDEVLNEKMILNNIYVGLKKRFNFTDDLEANKHILEANGYILGNKILTTFKQGRFDTLKNVENLIDRERWVEADYQDNRIDLLHAFHELDRVIHLPVSKVEAMLKRFFLWRGYSRVTSILKLDASEWTAFILNNWRTLREEFRKIDVAQAIQGSLDLDNIQKNDFTIPLTERYTYNPKLPDTKMVQTNVYKGYTTASIAVRPSIVERLMERWLEEHSDIVDFVYKNGDKGPQYFSLVYSTNGGVSHFYPDFIIQMKNGDVYIIETKGGEDVKGRDKNIDSYAPAKYEALKKYAANYDIKWAFVRDMNEELYYLNNGEWVDEMITDRWKTIEELFNRN